MVNFSSTLPAALVRSLVVLLLLASRLPAAAQAPAWQSAHAVATATAAAVGDYSIVTASTIDVAGNVYVAGLFTNSVVLGNTTLTSLGSQDIFVAKFSPVSNQFLWAQRAGGTNEDIATALAVSGTSVYLAGNFASSAAGFGSTILVNAGAAGTPDVFVTKLTDAGSSSSFVWTQRAGGTGSDQATAVAVSGTSVYLTGSFTSSTMGFGSTVVSNTGVLGTPDVFVTKLTDTGSSSSVVWMQRAGGTGSDQATALAVSGTSVYITGGFGATADFGSTTLTNAGIFVTKLTDAGNTGSFVWAQRAGGLGYNVATALAVSGISVYLAGDFTGFTTSFGPITLTNGGGNDIFVAKLTDVGNTGSFVWAQRAGGLGYDVANALVVRGTNVYVAGVFTGAAASFGTTTLTSAGYYDVFVAKLIDAGTNSSFVWAQRAGGTDEDAANTLVLNGTSIYVAGYFASPSNGYGYISFGTITLTNSSTRASLGFLASLTDPTLTATTPAVPREPAALYPNPARHTATLRLPAGTAPAPLTLTDALGRPVRRYPVPAGPETALDLRGLPAGLYLLRGAGPAQRLAVE